MSVRSTKTDKRSAAPAPEKVITKNSNKITCTAISFPPFASCCGWERDGAGNLLRDTLGCRSSLFCAQIAEELPHIAAEQVGHLIGSEVAAAVENRPVDDVLMVPIREAADAAKIAPERGQAGGHGSRFG